MSEIDKDQARREARRAKILAGSNDRLSKITGVYNASPYSNLQSKAETNNTPEIQENLPAEHYGPTQPTATVSPIVMESNLRNRLLKTGASSHGNIPLLQSPSIVRTPEKLTSSTISRLSPIPVSQGKTREVANSLTDRNELDAFPDPPDMLPSGVGGDTASSLDDKSMKKMMEAMIKAINNDKLFYGAGTTDDSKSPPAFTDGIPPLPNFQQQKLQKKAGISVQTWKLAHMISVSLLAFWAVYMFGTLPFSSIEEEFYDMDINVESLSRWQSLCIRLGRLGADEYTDTPMNHIPGHLSIWMLFLIIEISLQAVWFAYQSVFPDPPTPPTLWSEITSLHPMLQNVAKVVSDYRLVFSSIAEDVCTFVFVLGISVLVGQLSMSIVV